MTLLEAVQLVDAAARYAYNAEFDEFKELYATQDNAYLLTKYKMMQSNLGHFFGQLDFEHRERFVRLAIKRYAEKSSIAIPVKDE